MHNYNPEAFPEWWEKSNYLNRYTYKWSGDVDKKGIRPFRV